MRKYVTSYQNTLAMFVRWSMYVGRCRTPKSVRSLGREGVTRIPGATVHVGLIDSQRRRARVTRHQVQPAYAHDQGSFYVHAGRFCGFSRSGRNANGIFAFPQCSLYFHRRLSCLFIQVIFVSKTCSNRDCSQKLSNSVLYTFPLHYISLR